MTWTDVEIFEELFYHDIESWFSADIACCDNCYDDFIATWPHAHTADDYEFQKTGIPLDCFYSGSRLQETYTESKFESLVKELSCPRCGEKLTGNIWPYNLPFDVPDDFENTINEVCSIAENTPFLLLNNSFCSDIHKAISFLFQTSKSKLIKELLYRGRVQDENKLTKAMSHFDFPPAEVVSEGRYNHSGNPVLYLASDLKTCIAELRSNMALISEFLFTAPLHILDLVEPFENHENKSDILNALVYSALISAKHTDKGQYKPHYVVSRFTADCAREAGFDAIKYPSTRRAGGNYNLVVLNQRLSLVANCSEINFHEHAPS